MKRTLHNRRVSLLLVTVRTNVRMNVYAEIPYPEGLKNVLMEGRREELMYQEVEGGEALRYTTSN